VFKSDRSARSEDKPAYAYIEIIDVADIGSFWLGEVGSETMQKVAARIPADGSDLGIQS